MTTKADFTVVIIFVCGHWHYSLTSVRLAIFLNIDWTFFLLIACEAGSEKDDTGCCKFMIL